MEQECILTATGIDYAGKENVTASGKDCLPWKDGWYKKAGWSTNKPSDLPKNFKIKIV